LLGQTDVNFLEEARDGRGDGRANFEKSLSNGINGFDIGDGSALEKINVIERAAVHVGERQKRKRNVHFGLETEIVAYVGDVGAKVGVREHDALGFARCAGSVDDGSELARENLRSTLTVSGNVRGTGSPDECFVAKKFAGEFYAPVSHNDLLKFRKIAANGENSLELCLAGNKENFSPAMFEDIGHAVERFVEVDRDSDGTGACDGKVRGVPLGTVRGEEADAIAGLYAELHEGRGKASDAAKKFLGRNGFPAAVAPDHLGARVRKTVNCVQEAGGKRGVVHGLRLTVPYPTPGRNATGNSGE
jgi:hypothetical protein